MQGIYTTEDLLLFGFVLFCFCFIIPEGFTTMVADEGLEKARANLIQVPSTNGLISPLKGVV